MKDEQKGIEEELGFADVGSGRREGAAETPPLTARRADQGYGGFGRAVRWRDARCRPSLLHRGPCPRTAPPPSLPRKQLQGPGLFLKFLSNVPRVLTDNKTIGFNDYLIKKTLERMVSGRIEYWKSGQKKLTDISNDGVIYTLLLCK